MTDFDRLIILQEPLWRVQLADQRYLGRVYLILNREAQIDWLDLTGEELAALQNLGKRVRSALDKLFQPDIYNHATLRNAWGSSTGTSFRAIRTSGSIWATASPTRAGAVIPLAPSLIWPCQSRLYWRCGMK